MKSYSDYGISIPSGSSGEIKTTCPQCSDSRKKKHLKVLNVNLDKNVWHCWHCGWGGGLKEGIFQEAKIKVVYSRPKIKTDANLSAFWLKWLQNRGISEKTANENGVFNETVYMKQIESEVDAIVWPVFVNSEPVNCKYRDKDKNFRMSAGCERALYGYDHIKEDCLIWVEGEMDKLSFYEAGFKHCVSVPDGAPAVNTKNYSSKFSYLEAAKDKIEPIKKHIIAVDMDEPGQKLKNELIRRLGNEKCYVINWPEGCKDANDALLKHGKEYLINAIESAKPAPIEGIFYIEDVFDDLIELYQKGEVGGLCAGWPNLDPLYSVRAGDFTVVTGIPSHGKSEWLDDLMVRLAKRHGQRYVICSPENQPLQLHIKKIAEKWTGRPFFEYQNDRMTIPELITACDEMRNHFSFLLPEEPTIDCILSLARSEVYRNGINGLVIDPWNELEHSRPPSQSETEYISDSLRKMRKFARNNNIHLWIVAHPTKMQKKRGPNNEILEEYAVPTPYDIAGAAHWRNKADNCITVYRNREDTDVHVQKIRIKEVGKIGVAKFKYRVGTGQYFPVNY